jgi:CHAT domain-containing protein
VAARFTPLPETKREVEMAASIWRRRATEDPEGASTVLTGKEATEEAFKRLAPGRKVVHLATHGFFLGGSCAAPRETSRGMGGLVAEEAALPRRDERAENPLLQSGLVFAGVNDRARAGADEDDGVLTVEEITATDLSGVEWVVLSGCDTGLGDIVPDEGVQGLCRAFQVAGARAVIVSLWPVDDEATREWMTALYEHRFDRALSTPEAVRAASRNVLEDRRARGLSASPVYWGAFVAMGTWR